MFAFTLDTSSCAGQEDAHQHVHQRRLAGGPQRRDQVSPGGARQAHEPHLRRRRTELPVFEGRPQSPST